MSAFAPLQPADEASIADALIRADRFRRTPPDLREEVGHKEWLHFCVYGDDIDLLLNFSVVDDLRPGAKAELARLTLLAGRGRWMGEVRTCAPGTWQIRTGPVHARFPGGFIQLAGGRYFLEAELEDLGLRTRLYLEPRTMPSLVNNVAVGDGPPIHWMVAPRLLATGFLETPEGTHVFERVPAYHDHNWGFFRWGRNFAWEWGFGIPRALENPWTVVFVRLSDRLHTRVMMQGLFVWKGPREARVFRGHEVDVRAEGRFPHGPDCKVPGPMALLHPGEATDVPATFTISASGRGDEVEMCFASEAVGQVILPNDDDLGVTIINEVQGMLTVRGKIRGETVAYETRTIFEFLGG